MTHGSTPSSARRLSANFNRYFAVDEAVYLLESSVIVSDEAGVEHCLKAGDHAFFKRGSHAVWHVEEYVRNIAFSRTPWPMSFVTLKRIVTKLLTAPPRHIERVAKSGIRFFAQSEL